MFQCCSTHQDAPIETVAHPEEQDASKQLSTCAHPQEQDASKQLRTRLSRAEFVYICIGLGFDLNEADSIYDMAFSALRDEGNVTDGGLRLVELLDDLQIHPDDKGGVDFVAQLVKKAQANHHYSVELAVDTAVRLLNKSGKPAEKAWDVLMHPSKCKDCEGQSPPVVCPCSRQNLSHKVEQEVRRLFEGNRSKLTELVKAAMASPRMLPASSGQAACRERCIEEVEKIIKSLGSTSGAKYTDPDFDLQHSYEKCVFVNMEKLAPSEHKMSVTTRYERLSSILGNPVLFKDGAKPGDIEQGFIGTCYLCGALGAVAWNSVDPSYNALGAVFLKYDIQRGVYGVRFCINGEFHYVIVDDVMPVDEEGKLLYSRCMDRDEVWLPVLEKAYCKLYTCYEMCNAGWTRDAMFALTGGLSGILEKNVDVKNYFRWLQWKRSRGYLLTTTFAEESGGLKDWHVYSILKLYEDCNVQLVQCRNPWGHTEWTGRWCDECQEWTEALKKATGFTKKNDGIFWMSIEDFMQHSKEVLYTKTFGPEYKKVTQYKRFASSAACFDFDCQWVGQAPTALVVVLIQDNLEQLRRQTEYPTVRVTIRGGADGRAEKTCKIDPRQCIWAELKPALLKGSGVKICCSFTSAAEVTRFALRLYVKGAHVTLREEQG